MRHLLKVLLLASLLLAGNAFGQTVREELFGTQDPLGESVRLERTPCEVIGTLSEKGEAGMGQDQDDLVVLPLVAF